MTLLRRYVCIVDEGHRGPTSTAAAFPMVPGSRAAPGSRRPAGAGPRRRRTGARREPTAPRQARRRCCAVVAQDRRRRPVRLDVQARTLAVHSAVGYRERGASLTLTVGEQEREGPSLSLSLSPRWGDAASGTGALWQEEVYRHYLPEKKQDAVLQPVVAHGRAGAGGPRPAQVSLQNGEGWSTIALDADLRRNGRRRDTSGT